MSSSSFAAGNQIDAVPATSPVMAFRSAFARILIGLVCCVLTCLLLDSFLMPSFAEGALPGELRRTIMLCEAFAHGNGVVLILILLFAVDGKRWRRIVVAGGCALWSGLAADGIKVVVHRIRPRSMGDVGYDALASFKTWEFSSLSQLLSENAHAQQSFPSAHTATAFGFAFGLAWCYQKKKTPFLIIAVLAGIQRMVVGAHWPSDVVAGATVAFVIAPIVISLSERYWCSETAGKQTLRNGSC